MDQERIYVAAPGGKVERARAVAERLARDGFEIVSRWHSGHGPIDDARLTPLQAEDAWRTNREDVNLATLLVALTDEHAGRETYCEIARAIDRRIPVVWSLEHGGACLSRWAPGAIEVCAKDDRIPEIARALLRGYRSQVQHLLPRVGT